jgi:hypothetical protein
MEAGPAKPGPLTAQRAITTELGPGRTSVVRSPQERQAVPEPE